MSKTINNFPSFEQLEGRRLFSALDELHGVTADAIDVAAPSLTAARDVPLARAAVDADLGWLANHTTAAQRASLAKADSALLTLHSRARRGLATSALGQAVEGVDVPKSHIVRGDGVPLVLLHVTDVDAVRPRLEALGVQIAGTVDKPEWQLIDAYVPIGKVLEVADVPGVKAMRSQRRPHVNAAGDGINQWDAISGAAQYRSIFPSVDGGGIDFGVMSDSIDKTGNGVAGSQADGDLPPGNRVTILDDGTNNDTDEGRAMAELIYDIAPGADILFHTAGAGITNFVNGIDDLRAAGADVIVDDVTYFDEPAFQDGVIAQAVDDVYLNHSVLYFSSAGNENNTTLLDTWDNPDGDDFHNFATGGEIIPITVAANTDTEFLLQFDDPWGAAGANFEIQVFDFDGGVVGDRVAASNDDNTPIFGGGNPYDDVTISNNDSAPHNYAISIKHLGGNSPTGQRLFLYNFDAAFTPLNTLMNNQPASFGHHNARWGFGIGAVPQASPGTIEPFSSLGGIPVVFDDAGNPISPVVRDNPAFVAADQVQTGVNRFSTFTGTSAAAPNAAAVAGLMMEVNGGARSLTWTQFRDLARDTAVDLGTFGYDSTYGYGRIDALGALFATKGPDAAEATVELNQFGRGTLDGRTLGSVTDVDHFLFAPDSDGAAVVSVVNPAASLNPGLALYDQDAGIFLAHNDDALGTTPAVLVTDLQARNFYLAEIFAENTGFSDAAYEISVLAPAPSVGNINIDDGDGSVDTEIGHADSDYWRVTVPETVSGVGELVVTLDPAAALDGVLTVFHKDGNQVRRRDAAGAGGVETATISDLEPGAQYVIRVAGVDHATEGDYSLSVHVDLDLPATFTAAQAQGTAIFNHDGVANNASDLDLNINVAGDVDSLVFAGNSGWDGQYEVRVNAPLLGDLTPVVGVYDGASGELIQIARPNGLLGSATVTFDGEALTKYVLAVADVGANNSGDLTFTITAPGSNQGTELTPDALGDAMLEDRTLSPQADSDFYSFTVPDGVAGGRLTMYPDATFDGIVALFDPSGNFLAASDSGAAGEEDAVNLLGLLPGERYRMTVLPDQHASTGDYTLHLDLTVPTGTVRGKVFEDANADGVHDASESGLNLWMAYADLNGNGVYDKLAGGQEEPHALSAPDGSYAIADVPLGTWAVREEVQLGWVQSAPAGGSHSATLAAAGEQVSGLHFGNYRPAMQPVVSWQDDDADGFPDAGEPTLPGRQVWVDYDDDGAFDAGDEPFVLTGAGGAGTIVGIRPGTWPVRERLPNRTWRHTRPVSGAQQVTLVSGQLGGGILFGSYQPMDFGDAPASYGTTIAAGGAAHFARSPWFLGKRVDTELDGVPSVAADGDDLGPAGAADDEDGVRFLDPLGRGRNARVLVRASRPGRLNGWIDFNADGDFLDAGDFALANVPVPHVGVYTFNVPVPAGAMLGDTYARFRFNQAGGIGPVGFGGEGEVEDYAVKIVPHDPPQTAPAVASAAVFGSRRITSRVTEEFDPASGDALFARRSDYELLYG